MSDKYTGKIGPADAMDATELEFMKAYAIAGDAILQAVLDFERATGRVVDEIALERVDLTTIAASKTIRGASLHFLPKPSEVAW